MKAASDISQHIDGIAAATTPRAASRPRWVDLCELTKPRMNLLVVITTMVGFCVASRGPIEWILLLNTLLGTALSAAAASVFNQLIERDYDALMPRTRNRPLPGGRITSMDALLLGFALGLVGVGCLALLVNMLTAMLALVTILSYVLIYTPLKRHTSLNTIVGAVPGAIPPLMGFTAVTNAISPQGLALFGILFFWQMPHFLSIAILYRGDYQLAGFKMLPVIDPDLTCTARQIVLYSLAMIPASLMPSLLGMTGATYFTSAVLLGLAFLSFAVSCATTRTRCDARMLFFASILYLPLLLGVMMIDKT